ncbi:MAG TPA: class I SAM-dependent methyltransferase [Baekduia sp.]|nr:class I SAM-dependent methyltransferase [Baekduia sp.]
MSRNVPSLREFLTTGTTRERARNAARLVTPIGVELVLIARRNARRLKEIDASIVRDAPPPGTRVEEAIRFLVASGLDEEMVRAGSIPEDNLDYVREVVADRLPSDRPVRALHVGNFVGISLCYVSWLVRERDPDSVVVSVDPNITHRGVEQPQSHVLALLHHFGMLANNVIIPGYTLEQSAGETVNDQFETDYLQGLACENVFASLARVTGKRFDLVLLDGSHEEDYLEREFAAVGPLIADDAIVVFDDVSDSWQGVARVFSRAVQDSHVVELGQDGRVGIVQVGAANDAALTVGR